MDKISMTNIIREQIRALYKEDEDYPGDEGFNKEFEESLFDETTAARIEAGRSMIRKGIEEALVLANKRCIEKAESLNEQFSQTYQESILTTIKYLE